MWHGVAWLVSGREEWMSWWVGKEQIRMSEVNDDSSTMNGDGDILGFFLWDFLGECHKDRQEELQKNRRVNEWEFKR